MKSILAPRAVSQQILSCSFRCRIKELELNPELTQHLLPASCRGKLNFLLLLLPFHDFLGKSIPGKLQGAPADSSSSLKIQELKSPLLPKTGSFPLILPGPVQTHPIPPGNDQLLALIYWEVRIQPELGVFLVELLSPVLKLLLLTSGTVIPSSGMIILWNCYAQSWNCYLLELLSPALELLSPALELLSSGIIPSQQLQGEIPAWRKPKQIPHISIWELLN